MQIPDDFEVTADEVQQIMAISESLRVLREIFNEGEGTLSALRMVAATIGAAAESINGIADRLEAMSK